jgi:hypothetical protein
MLDYETLEELAAGKSIADAACPLCAGGKSAHGARRKVLRVYIKDEGFATYCCARCGAKGFAHANRRDGGSRGVYEQALDVVKAFQKKPRIVAPDKSENNNKTDLARSLWRRSRPATGTIVETYLRKRQCWVATDTVHFLPASGEHAPCMIVPFGLPTEIEPGVLDIVSADIFGVQLTKLKPDGSGKADVEPNKMTLGQCLGFPVVLAPANDSLSLVIAEGVETALTAHLASGNGAWAAGGAMRLPALAERLPSYVESVLILRENDDAGRRGGDELAKKIYKRGGTEVKVRTISADEVVS